MLNQKQIKLPTTIKIFFLTLEGYRFLVFNNIKSDVFLSIKIPSSLIIKKNDKNLTLCNAQPIVGKNQLNSFFTYLKNFITGFQTPAKKTLILRGLGLKVSIGLNTLNLKLGYSHDNIIKLPENTNNFVIGKKFITILNYNKLFLGNFAEKIYRLKKANCYKGRGLYYKQKKHIIKVVKKT
jgi:large subunit ribosomal protein L6